jgi:hypothetical protein
VTELSAAQSPEVVELSATEKTLLAESAESAIELSAIKNDWPQAFTNEVKKFIGTDDAGILLSRDEQGGSRFKSLLALLDGFPLKGLREHGKEKTGIQLSREIPDAEATAPKLEDNPLVKLARSMNGAK